VGATPTTSITAPGSYRWPRPELLHLGAAFAVLRSYASRSSGYATLAPQGSAGVGQAATRTVAGQTRADASDER
jgi:hypothetical protein